MRSAATILGAFYTVLMFDQVYLVPAAFLIFLNQYSELGRTGICGGDILWFYLVNGIGETCLVIHPGPTVLRCTKTTISWLCFLLEYYGSNTEPPGFENSTIFGKIGCNFLRNILVIAPRRQMLREDFPGLPSDHNSRYLYTRFNSILLKYSPKWKYRVIWSVLENSSGKILLSMVLEVAGDIFTYSRPMVLAFFLQALSNYQDGTAATLYPAYYFAALLGATQLASSSLYSLQSTVNNLVFVTSRTALMATIYRKAIALSATSRVVYDSSKIMNLLNVDTAMLQLVYRYIPTLVSAPIGVVLCTWQLYRFMGLPSLGAIPVYALFIPYSSWYTRKMFKRFPELMKAKDKRTKAIWGIFRNIKSLKLYAWEVPYEAETAKFRAEEIGVQAKYLRLKSAMNSVSIMLDDFVATAIFIAFLYYTGGALTPGIVFPTLSLLGFLSDPFLAFPRAVSAIGRAMTAQTRINEFLDQPEHNSQNFIRAAESVASTDFEMPTVEVKNACFSWTEDNKNIITKNFSLTLKRGDLCCLIGKVGTGKTAILRGLSDQMHIASGSVKIRGSIAYCSQEPWLQYKSIRDNVLFGLQYEEDFYFKVLECCQLTTDIATLEEGDLTEIGEKGIRLSGGQKARVALARAIYSRADVYLLDDILSAVDEHIGRELIQHVLSASGILSSKTIILATNSKKVLRHASSIVSLDSDDQSLLMVPCADASISDDESGYSSSISISLDTSHALSRKEKLHIDNNVSSPREDTEIASKAVFTQQLQNEEDDQRANVLLVFRRYLSSVGPWSTVVAIVFLVGSVLFSNLIVIWLTVWSDKELKGLKQARFYVLVYLLLSLAAGTSIFSSNYWFLGHVGNKASVKLHAAMVDSVVNSPLTFFDQTPLGALMNRFTGDVSTLDMTVPTMLYFFFRSVVNTIINFSIMIFGAPFVIFALPIIFYLYNYYRRLYIPVSRQIQRIVSAARSPILSHIEESVKGVSTIKSFAKISQFIDIYEFRNDYWVHAAFLKNSLNRWLSWRISALTVIMTWCSALCMIVILQSYSRMPIGIVGVVLHSTQRGGQLLSRIIKSVADIEVSAVAVERVFEYCDLPQEAQKTSPSDPPPGTWPTNGAVEFCDYSARYRPELPDILKKLNLSITSKEKIGVVGRSGAGKSSFSLAIFRIVEASHGHISIDGADTSLLGLRTLRQNLSIIPQDAQIFAGTVRSNLDPFGEVMDQKLWDVLRLCHLSEHFSKLGTGLDSELIEGGENLSRGQAQLICLGRTLLHDSPILVLDEATASVDNETDEVVQKTIRSEFRDKTIITIAHRLNTIMDCDRILVLDHGEAREFDTPDKLLESKGIFWSLVQTPEEL